VIMAFFATFAGFALIWHIWWLAIVSMIGVTATALTQAWRVENEVEIPAEKIAAFERSRPRGEVA
jgi:cytochrome o ubiquinol oxidase subunit 1